MSERLTAVLARRLALAAALALAACPAEGEQTNDGPADMGVERSMDLGDGPHVIEDGAPPDSCVGVGCPCDSDAPCVAAGAGMICDISNGVCVAGCNPNVPCPGGLECCNNDCTAGCCSNDDCPQGKICDPATHSCGVCSGDAECGTAGRCCDISGTMTCVLGDCCGDSDCSTGQTCAGHTCRGKCDTSNPCAGGSVCCQGACYTGDCCSNGDCTGGQACLGNSCGPCTIDGQCGSGEICDNGACTKGCNGNVGCAGGSVCCGSAGMCNAGDTGCSGACVTGDCCDDSDCASGGCASDHTCRAPCASATACGANESCCGGFCYAGACVETLAGSGLAGAPDEAAADAHINGVYALVEDSAGNLFFNERISAGIRVLNNSKSAIGPVAPGTVGRLIGGGHGCRPGPAATAAMRTPMGLARDASGNIYAADYNCAVIWKISSDYKTVTVLAGKPGNRGLTDGTGDVARLRYPRGLTLGPDDRLYFTEYQDSVIRRVSLTGVVETVAGVAGERDEVDGPAATAKFDYPITAAMDAAGTLFVGDWQSGAVRKIEGLVSGNAQVYTIVPTKPDPDPDPRRRWLRSYGYAGYGISASTGQQVYLNFWNKGIWRLSPPPSGTDWNAEQLITTSGAISSSLASAANQIWLGGWVNSSAANSYHHQLIKYDLNAKQVLQKVGKLGITRVADGAAGDATFAFSSCDGALTVDDGGNVWVTDRCVNRVRKIAPDGTVSSFGSGAYGAAAGTAATAKFCYPTAILSVKTDVYVVNRNCGRQISKIDAQGAVTLVGSTCVAGEPACPQASAPGGMAIDSNNNLYVTTNNESGAGRSTKYNNSYWDGMPMVVKIPPGTGGEIGAGAAVFFAGTPNNPHDPANHNTCRDGPLGAGQFGYWPYGLAIDSVGYLYVGDGACGVRKVAPDGTIQTLPNSFGVVALAIGKGSAGAETLFVSRGNEIWTVDRLTGAAAWYAGDKAFGYDRTYLDGSLAAAKFWGPHSMAVHSSGKIYVLDRYNNRIRVINP